MLSQALKTHSAADHRSSHINFVVDTYPSVSTKAYEGVTRSTAGTIRVKTFNGQQSCLEQWKKISFIRRKQVRAFNFFCTDVGQQ